nr:MAG TPA: hypothetical protein [Caudoviricetes sp.]
MIPVKAFILLTPNILTAKYPLKIYFIIFYIFYCFPLIYLL